MHVQRFMGFIIPPGFPFIVRFSLVIAFIAISLLAPNKALARNYYVSLRGNNSDGASWQTAWNELNQIRYNQLVFGDTVFLDGGMRGRALYTYRTPLDIPAYVNGVHFAHLYTDGNHNSPITIDGTGSGAQCGITVRGNYNYIDGGYQNGITVQNFPTGVQTFPQTTGDFVQCLEIKNNRTGIYVAGHNPFDHLLVHDNIPINVSQTQTSGTPDSVTLSNSWIYNTNSSTTDPYIFGIYSSPGVSGSLSVSNCVIGPCLGFGLGAGSSCNVSVVNTLFLDSVYFNICANGNAGLVTLSNVTSFMTPLNLLGQGNSGIYSNRTGGLAIDHSIFYGGQVALPPGRFANTTTEFGVTGNTVALADRQLDPLFTSELTGNLNALGNNPSFASFFNLNFGLAPNSPAAGEGSSIQSIATKFF